MRCPKCGASFRVSSDGSVSQGSAEAKAALKRTALGVGSVGGAGGAAMPGPPPPPPAQKAVKHTIVGAVPAVPPVPPPAPARKPLAPNFAPAAPQSTTAQPDADLPAPAGARRRPLAPDFAAAAPQSATAQPDADLPAPAGARRRPLRHTPFDAWANSATPAEDKPARKDDTGSIDFAAASEELGGWDLDLPTTSGRPGASDPLSLDDLDLPVASGAPGGLDLDLPIASGAPGGLDLDITSASRPDQQLDLDLPTTSGGADLPARPRGNRPDADLPARSGSAHADLPARAGGIPDLAPPSPRSGDDLDLPVPTGGVDLPAHDGRAMGLDLPRPSGSPGGLDLDLPIPSGHANLPIQQGRSNLPARSSDIPAIPGVRMPEHRQAAARPAAGGVALPQPGARARQRQEREENFGYGSGQGSNLDLDAGGGFDPGGLDLDLIDVPTGGGAASPNFGGEAGDFDLPAPRAPQTGDDFDLPAPRARQAGEASGGFEPPLEMEAPALDLAAEPDLEFEDVPQMEAPGGGVQARGPRPVAKRKSAARTVIVALLLVFVLAGAGAALKLTPYGLFGRYFVEQFLPEAGDPATTKTLFEEVEAQTSLDGFSETREALAALSKARRKTGLNRALLSRSVVVEALYQIRFGDDPHSDGRISGILARLAERGYRAPGAELARAAAALADGDIDAAKRFLASVEKGTGAGPYADLLGGEIALAEGEGAAAKKAFEAARASGAGARAEWGIVRSLQVGAEGDLPAAIEATLAANPQHVGARVAKGRRAWAAHDEKAATELLLQAAGWKAVGEQRLRGSASERSAAWTALGAIHEARGRRTQAREAYERAIDLDSERFEALLGSGRIGLADHRFADALTRFKAVANAEGANAPVPDSARPAVVDATIGIAEALVALDRAQGALAAIGPIAAKRKDDPAVQRVLGQTHRALGSTTDALAAFDRAIELDPTSFEAYVAKVELHLDRGEAEEATAVLQAAREKIAETAEIRRMMGHIELKQNHLEAAKKEFEAALALDPGDVASRFGVGVVQRRSGQLGAASTTFDEVAAASATFPGLALERGRIFEAQGDPARALESYQRALTDSPADPGLLALVGHAQLITGALDEAKTTAEALLEARPESPDTRLLIGRVEVALGNVQEGVVHLEHALQLDPARPDIHLHLGWAMLAKRSLGRALDEANEALKRDEKLAEAYWLRGRVRARAGLVRDAMRDLEKAYKLAPNDHEVLADMAETFLQMDDRSSAIEAYGRATRANPTRGDWWSKLAFLFFERSMNERALEAATQSVANSKGNEKAPWLAEAHRILGDIKRRGDRKAAADHYRKYLEIAPPSALDRGDVERALAKIEGASP